MKRDEIINQVLEDRRDLGLYEVAVNRFHKVLERVYKSHTWPFLLKSATVAFGAGDDSQTLPSNFYKHFIAKVIVPNTNPQSKEPLTWKPVGEFLLLANDSGEGTLPDFYTITPEPAEGNITTEMLVYPAFSEARSVELWYYHIPVALTTNVEPIFTDHAYLIQCLDNEIKGYQSHPSYDPLFIEKTISVAKQNLAQGGVQVQ